MVGPPPLCQGGAVMIRREQESDRLEADEVHRQAFASSAAPGDEPLEVGLNRALRDDDGFVPELSWVADDGRVVGHVICTKGTVGDAAALGLGPIGVLPSHQGRHIGHALMRSVIGAADALGYPVIALLGDPRFYSRFGFVTSTEIGIDPPDPSWGVHFQVRTLATHTAELQGTFRYAAPFDAL
jgi:putative acetyltransferase